MRIRDHPPAARSPGKTDTSNGSSVRLGANASIIRSSLARRTCVAASRPTPSIANEVRTHLALRKDAPKFRRVQSLGSVVARPLLGGLHHQYVRV
jgi:hypothetical protein